MIDQEYKYPNKIQTRAKGYSDVLPKSKGFDLPLKTTNKMKKFKKKKKANLNFTLDPSLSNFGELNRSE